jgi:hypothetical protein
VPEDYLVAGLDEDEGGHGSDLRNKLVIVQRQAERIQALSKGYV